MENCEKEEVEKKDEKKRKEEPNSPSGAMGEPQPRSTPHAASTSLPNLTSFKEKIKEREFLFLNMSSRSRQDKADRGRPEDSWEAREMALIIIRV